MLALMEDEFAVSRVLETARLLVVTGARWIITRP
jgi:hypothetical protein